jgi:hypothetical protein
MRRVLPWLVVLAAYVAPPAWAYFAIERDAAAQMASRGMACGIPAVGLMLWACIGTSALSVFATSLRGSAVGWWRGVPPMLASAEIAAFTLPLIAALSFAAYLFLQ